MSEQTKIAWCDSTVNFWSGCEKISAGCAHCYADERDARMLQEKVRHFGKGAPRLKSKSAVKAALAMNRKPWVCNSCGEARAEWEKHHGKVCACYAGFHRRRVFSLSLGDWLDDAVPIEWLAEMLDTIRQCDQVTWILCSKRWENFHHQMERSTEHAWNVLKNQELQSWLWRWYDAAVPPRNIIGLCSVENQEMADKRIPQFLTVPLACRGLSLEPLLGAVNLRHHLGFKNADAAQLDWLIAGGESGPKARPCEIDWIISLVQQGKSAGVPTFVKQLGAAPIEPDPEHDWRPVPNITDKKGGDKKEWPKDLQIQEFPKL